ncbi:MAG: outer rane efflux protein [Fibrobacteres bacterium]|nr:outer rane efflux protein [Fibrobacterota bacterium]
MRVLPLATLLFGLLAGVVASPASEAAKGADATSPIRLAAKTTGTGKANAKPGRPGKAAASAKTAPANEPDTLSAPTDTSTAPAGSNQNGAQSDSAAGNSPAVPPAQVSAPSGIVLDYAALERRAQEVQPILQEKMLEIDKAKQQMRDLEMGAILPRFQLETGMGPAPGLRNILDTTSLILPGGGGYIAQNQKDFDFKNWGPFFGIEMTVAQPLNLARYRAGHKAAASNIKVSEAQFQKERLDVSEEAQKLYFQRVYAGQMFTMLKDATRELDRAQKKMEELLDEGDEGIKQTDLLELKAGRYTLEKSRNEAGLGMARADLGLRFLIQVPDSVPITLRDSSLVLRAEAFPSLDSLKMLTLLNHPDLKRLANGLAARRELVRVAKGEIGPDIFLFGTFKYTKAWSTDRQSGGEDPFARDPLNEITGVGGLGMKLNLNFWSRYQKVRKEKIELTQLERTEAYAARGLLIRMQDEYIQMLNHRANVNEAQKSLRAAEGWLKGAALKYDLDPSTAKDMISPYKTVLGARRDYYEAVMNYNLAVSKVIKSIGWTLTDYFHNLGTKGQ